MCTLSSANARIDSLRMPFPAKCLSNSDLQEFAHMVSHGMRKGRLYFETAPFALAEGEGPLRVSPMPRRRLLEEACRQNRVSVKYNGRRMSPASIGGGFHFRLSVVGYNPPLKPGGAEAPGARCSRSLRP